jgi:hypothetical protein
VIDVPIILLFITIEDKPPKQFVVSNRWHIQRVNHLQKP